MAEYTGGSVVSYYVDGVNGDNSDNGTSPGTAWKTIQYGFDKIADSTLGDGDELRIMATKVYHIGAPLTSTWNSKEVVITGATSANTALVDGTVVEINGNTADMDGKTMCHSSVATNDHTVFANLYFNAADNAQCCFHDSVTNTHLSRFINCRFSSAKEDGVRIDSSNYYRWYNCRFDNNAGIGCYQSGSQFAIAYKCLYDNNGGDGLKISINAVVIDCVSFGNSADGIESSVSGVDVVQIMVRVVQPVLVLHLVLTLKLHCSIVNFIIMILLGVTQQVQTTFHCIIVLQVVLTQDFYNHMVLLLILLHLQLFRA